MSDPRVSKALSVLLGIDLGAMGADNDGDMDMDDESGGNSPFGQSSPFSQQSTQSASSAPKKPDSKARPANMSDDQQKAWDEKELGNDAYKKKEFETALKHYETAIGLDPINVTYQTNKAGMFAS